MKTTRTVQVGSVLLAVGLLFSGCAKARKEVTDRDRKEAAVLASEAQFAINLRDWPRAEGLLSKAAALNPEPTYWLALGSARVRTGNRAGAKDAYQAALRAFEDEAARDPKLVEPWLNQVTVLALLGRVDDSRALLAKAAKRFPNDARLKDLLDPKSFDRMVGDPGFKENAL
jgi:tetratricopeptide (TPR) repeat protein